jgi:hypothetical protein
MDCWRVPLKFVDINRLARGAVNAATELGAGRTCLRTLGTVRATPLVERERRSDGPGEGGPTQKRLRRCLNQNEWFDDWVEDGGS